MTGDSWTACWLDGDRLTALVAVNRPRDLLQGRHAIERRTALDARLLADPDVPIRQAARSG